MIRTPQTLRRLAVAAVAVTALTDPQRYVK